MNLKTFKIGGIHPPEGKENSKNKPIQIILPKEGTLMVFPLSQHIGAPATPIVAKGDRVLTGQKIAEAESFLCSPIHSSVSGIVKDIKPMPTPSGALVNSIIIENDALYEEDASLGQDTDYTSFSRDKILDKIKNAGIVGLGGAGFPTHIKLNPPPNETIDSIIVNAAECEPYLTTDYRVLLEKTERIVKGLEIILKLHKNAKGYIAIENNKPDAITALIEATKDIDNISVIALMTKYPQGSEKQLIYAVTGREVASGKLPASAGCIVNNVDTVLAIERAVCKDRPLMRKIVTLSGDLVNNPGNYQVKIGMPTKDLLEEVGGLNGEAAKIISGGPMMGKAIYSLDVPIIKTTSALLFFSKEAATLPEESNCIRCGKCIEACPMGLMPLSLNSDAIFSDMASFESNNGLDCITCGSCSYVCPAKRHLAQTIAAYKGQVMASKRKS